MPEILTESFCERCGTRYTFEAAAPKARRFGALKVLSKGLVNFVANDESSLDEAFADARNERQRAQTTDQLDAFHKTFQFCMSCRQYTCGNCWNEADGRCLSCAPHLGQEVLAAPFAHLDAASLDTIDTGPDEHSHNGHGVPLDLATLAWPTTDLPQVAGPPPEPLVAAPAAPLEDEPIVEAIAGRAPEGVDSDPAAIGDDVAETAAHDAPRRAAAVASQSEPGHDTAAAAIARTTDLFARLRPGRRSLPIPTPQDLAAVTPAASLPEPPPATESTATDATLTALEAQTASDTADDAQPASQPAAEAGVDGVSGPMATSPMPALGIEPAAALPQLPPLRQPPPRQDPVETPVWSMVAPDLADASSPPAGVRRTGGSSLGPQLDLPARVAIGEPATSGATHSPADTPGANPSVWPSSAPDPAPQWPARAAIVAATRQGPDLWVASSQDVLNRPGSGVQACVSCGLPLSATARFCRRCGSQQH